MAEWRDGGRSLTTPAGNVFVRSAPGDGPTILLLHGYPSSSFDYRQVVPHLAGRAWLTLDFLGFGLSDKPRPHRYSLLGQADIVQTVVASQTTGPIVVVAHDMGTSVTTELLARDLQGRLPFELQRVVLSNGSVILRRASLRPVQKLLRGPLGPLAARLSSKGRFSREFARLFGPNHPLSAEEADAQWALIANNDGHRIAHLLIFYLDERERYAERWHGAVRDWPKTAELPLAARRPGGDYERARWTTRIAARRRRCRVARGRSSSAGRGALGLHPRGAEPAVNGVALAQEGRDR